MTPTSNIDVATYQTLFTRPNTVIVGDLNAINRLWNCVTDDRGRAVEWVKTQNNFVVLNTGQTTFLNSRGHFSDIDLTLVSRDLGTKCSWHTVNNAMGFDYQTIVTEIDDTLGIESSTLPKWKLEKAD